MPNLNLVCPKCKIQLTKTQSIQSRVYEDRTIVTSHCPNSFSCGVKEITLTIESEKI